MLALITRPEADARPLAAALAARGIDSLVAPLLNIRHLRVALRLDPAVQALLVTSANGVRAFCANTRRRDLPVLAVGDATAREARAAGFTRVDSAGGDVADLARLVRDRLDPAGGELLHPAGSAVAGDLGGWLAAAGFRYRREVLYTAEPVTGFDPTIGAALAEGRIDAVLFFSPRTAISFVTVARQQGLAGCLGSVDACALSPAVATRLRVLDWRAIHVAAEPTQPALIDCLLAMCASPSGGRGS